MIPSPAKGKARRKPCTEKPSARFDEEREVGRPLFYSTFTLKFLSLGFFLPVSSRLFGSGSLRFSSISLRFFRSGSLRFSSISLRFFGSGSLGFSSGSLGFFLPVSSRLFGSGSYFLFRHVFSSFL